MLHAFGGVILILFHFFPNKGSSLVCPWWCLLHYPLECLEESQLNRNDLRVPGSRSISGLKIMAPMPSLLSPQRLSKGIQIRKLGFLLIWIEQSLGQIQVPWAELWPCLWSTDPWFGTDFLISKMGSMKKKKWGAWCLPKMVIKWEQTAQLLHESYIPSFFYLKIMTTK